MLADFDMFHGCTALVSEKQAIQFTKRGDWGELIGCGRVFETDIDQLERDFEKIHYFKWGTQKAAELK